MTAGLSFLLGNVNGNVQRPERDKPQPEECGRACHSQYLTKPPGDPPGLREQDGSFSPSGTAFPVSEARFVLDSFWLGKKKCLLLL